MTPKGFPELGQNPSGHSNKSNNNEIIENNNKKCCLEKAGKYFKHQKALRVNKMPTYLFQMKS